MTVGDVGEVVGLEGRPDGDRDRWPSPGMAIEPMASVRTPLAKVPAVAETNVELVGIVSVRTTRVRRVRAVVGDRQDVGIRLVEQRPGRGELGRHPEVGHTGPG